MSPTSEVVDPRSPPGRPVRLREEEVLALLVGHAERARGGDATVGSTPALRGVPDDDVVVIGDESGRRDGHGRVERPAGQDREEGGAVGPVAMLFVTAWSGVDDGTIP